MKINIVTILFIILLTISNVTSAGLGYYTCDDGIEAQWKYTKFFLPKEAQPFTGKLCMYFENGQKSIESSIVDGLFSGKKTYWYQNGQKYSEVFFTKNAARSKATFYHKTGEVKEVEEYINNKLSKTTFYYKNGEVKSIEKY
jgi:antitoxin component YwqK of YwqJK toxin-antitoxin module